MAGKKDIRDEPLTLRMLGRVMAVAADERRKCLTPTSPEYAAAKREIAHWQDVAGEELPTKWPD